MCRSLAPFPSKSSFLICQLSLIAGGHTILKILLKCIDRSKQFAHHFHHHIIVQVLMHTVAVHVRKMCRHFSLPGYIYYYSYSTAGPCILYNILLPSTYHRSMHSVLNISDTMQACRLCCVFL